nr:hypothetical protein [Tanacetum cinerariifolium]
MISPESVKLKEFFIYFLSSFKYFFINNILKVIHIISQQSLNVSNSSKDHGVSQPLSVSCAFLPESLGSMFFPSGQPLSVSCAFFPESLGSMFFPSVTTAGTRVKTVYESYYCQYKEVTAAQVKNGATLPRTQVVDGVTTMMPIITAEEKAQRRLELLEAVEKRFSGNAATKKIQRNLLKQQFKNFSALSSEMQDQTFDRLQKLVSQLELIGEKISQEDVNQKLLRSLSPEWNTHIVVRRNKVDLDTMSMDDLYKSLKVYEPEVKGLSSSNSNTQNMAFLSTTNSNTNRIVNTAQAVNATNRVSTASTQVNASFSTNIDNLLLLVQDLRLLEEVTTVIVDGVTNVMPITTAEEKAQRRLKVKARSTLMMSIPNEHQLKFNSIKDAKQLLEAVEKRFVNTANEVSTASTQVNVAFSTNIYNVRIKSQDSAYMVAASKVPMLKPVIQNGATLPRTQVVDGVTTMMPITTVEKKALKVSESVGAIGQPNSPQLGHEDLEQIHPNDIKEMYLRWKMAMLTMRARRFLKKTGRKLSVNGNETLGFDMSKVECYNCHKREHFSTKCRALRNQDTKHKESTKRSVHVETPASTTLVSCDGLGGYDLSDQVEEGPNYALMAYTSLSSDSKVSNDSNCSKTCLETVKLLKSQNEQLSKDLKRSELMVRAYKTGAIKELRRKLEVAQKEKDGIQLTVEKLENASKSVNKLIDCQIVDNCKKVLGYESYNADPPPYTGNFMPLKPDLSFTGLNEFAVKPVDENVKAKFSNEESKAVRKNSDALIIEEWVSDDKEENVTQPKIVKKIVNPSIIKKEFVKPTQQEKTARKTV